MPFIAARASAFAGISTNPNPLGSPLYLSLRIVADETCPKASKAFLKSSSVTPFDKLPTKIFTLISIELDLSPASGRYLEPGRAVVGTVVARRDDCVVHLRTPLSAGRPRRISEGEA